MNELRLALRRLVKRPASTLASIATLACAIGAVSVTWSALSAVLLDPLPIHDSSKVFVVGQLATSGRFAGRLETGLVYPHFAQVRDSGVFSETAATWASAQMLLTDNGDGVLRATGIKFVTHNFFRLLGVAVVGRDFSAEDDRRGSPPVAIVSNKYWRTRLNGASDVIGRVLAINKQPVRVIGIADRSFRGVALADVPDIYLPFHTIGEVAARENYFAEVNVGRSPTAGTVIIGRAQTDRAEEVSARLATVAPVEGRRANLSAGHLSNEAVTYGSRKSMRQFAGVLAATVGLLLAIGCGTVGMLLLVRTESRSEEFAMCLALGAPRTRLARGVAFEGGLLALAGAVLAIPVTVVLFRLLASAELPGGVVIESLELGVNRQVVAAAIAASLCGTLVIALIAGVFGFRARTSDALRGSSGATPRVTRRRTRTAVVVGQVAVAVVLLCGAGLFTRSLMAALSLNAGYDPARLVASGLSLGPYGYSEPRGTEFYGQLRQRVERHPSVHGFSYFTNQGGMGGPMAVDGVLRQFPRGVMFVGIDGNYFSTMGMPVVSGRGFGPDDRPQAPLVGVVSESLARALSAFGTPIGRRITMPYRRPPAPAPQVEIVGVVPDVITSVATLEPLVLYLPLAQQPSPSLSRQFLVRTPDPSAARREILAAIRDLDASVSPAPLETMQERLGKQMAAQQFGARVLAALGLIAVLLTLFGTYVLSDSMASIRMREMGIRAALGASPASLGRVVILDAARLVGAGIVVGLAAAWLGGRQIEPLLFRVRAVDPVTIAAVATAMFLFCLLITTRAAVRVARVDLAHVLRRE